MRVVLANNRYFMVGGTTRYLFNVQAMLGQRGHVAIPFSNRYEQTVENPYLEYFVEPPGGRSTPFFRDAPMTAGRAWSLFRRGVYDRDVRRALGRLIREQRADLVYSINICNFLGPSVIDAAHDEGVPYVMRLSDFNLLCPAYLHLRDGAPCEDCRGGLHHALRHRCLQDSWKVTLGRVLAMWVQRWMRIYHRVDRIVTPSAFLRAKLVEGGFSADRIDHVPTFVDLAAFPFQDGWEGREVVFCGRISPEKGPELLIEAASRLPLESALKVVFLGGGDSGYVTSLRTMAEEVAPGRVEFGGFLHGEALVERLGRALAIALPSRCFENMPNVLSEGMALGRPLLTTGLGSLPEQVTDGENGRVLPVDEPEAWARAILELREDSRLAERMGRAGRRRAETQYDVDSHYRRLLQTWRAAGVRMGDPEREAPEPGRREG